MPEENAEAIITDELSLSQIFFCDGVLPQQGVEPEEFPLLLQSLKTDSFTGDFTHNTNKKLYRGKYVFSCLFI